MNPYINSAPRLIRNIPLLLLAGLATLANLAWAQSAGTVQFVSGAVSITRGAATLTPMRATIINTGDVIATEANSHIQLAMIDGASLSVRPGSRILIEKYDYNPQNPTLSDAVISLVTGTMRVFTGELVNRDKDKFKMKTPVAALGIRGSGNVLAHFETTGTINHTLTGAHSVTSQVGGTERTLVSLPGQTIQVLPGQAPRFIPTPSFILAAASPPVKASASGDGEKTDGSQSQTAAATAPASSSSTTTSTNPAVAAAQGAITAAATATVLSNTTSTNVTAFFRSTLPLAGGGFQGVFPQGGDGTAVLNSSNQLVALPNTSFSTFLSGAATLPAGYTPVNIANANVRIVDGTHFDGYRSTDGSVTIGRWQGGTISVTDLSQPNATATLYTLGSRSLAYAVIQGTPLGMLASFTGTTTYSLVSATAPTDAAGNAGRMNTATVTFNFSNLTAALNASLTINNQNLTMTGTTGFTRDSVNPNWSRTNPTATGQTLDIACTGSGCASVGYTGVASAQVAGANGSFAAGQYRIVPTRQAGAGFSDQIVGTFALQAGSNPTVGIVLPQSGTANLVWTGITNNTPTNAVNALNISGTLAANFSNRTVSFSANIGGVGPNAAATAALPSYTASAANVPIVGAGFTAATSLTGANALTVNCTGAACGAAASRFGRFDGFFSDNTGTRGSATVNIGDASTNYNGTATFGTGTGPVTPPAATGVSVASLGGMVKPGRLAAADVAAMTVGNVLAKPAALSGMSAQAMRQWRGVVTQVAEQ